MQLLLKIDSKCDNLDSKYEKQNVKLDEQKRDSDVKFNKINSKFDEQKNEINDKLNEQNSKFDEIRNEIKQQNFDFNKHIKEINTRCDSIKEQILESVNHKFDEQIKPNPPILNAIPKLHKPNNPIRPLMPEGSIMTVSYTHLDVYKRQA